MKYLDSMKIDNPESWLETALNCKKDNVDLLKELEHDLTNKYDGYNEIIFNYAAKPDGSEFLDHKELLVDYYEHPPTRLNRLVVSRRTEHDLLACPFCGNPKEPDTLDHFIPKDDWPEFSINPNNLVPQCRGCAPTKSSKYYCDVDEAAIYLHPMYSDLLSKFRFKITVGFSEPTKKVSFTLTLLRPQSIASSSTERVVRHFKQLRLQKRIQLYCYREFKKWKSLLTKHRFKIEDALNQRLTERPIQARGKDWETALYSGILENRDLVNYLNSLASEDLNEGVEETEVEIEL
ncbi:HNH endonuclease [Salinivibrio kushneri]|uniref:HNH endonuclease n=1 Tax=Salinivibrio kushneri TaxID=1908198 RepID=UPI000C85B1D3|nr:HNH endonuclease [Salinivibrio kushneri]